MGIPNGRELFEKSGWVGEKKRRGESKGIRILKKLYTYMNLLNDKNVLKVDKREMCI